MSVWLGTPLKPWSLAFLALALGTTWLASSNRFAAFVLGLVAINILWTAGMNLLYGYTGLVSLLYAGIAGISAYGTVGLVMRAHWSFWTAMPVSAVGAGVVGVLLGLPSLRLRGFYFALSTLVIQTVLSLGFIYFPALTNGDTGITQIPPPDLPFTAATLHGLPFDLVIAAVAWLAVVSIRTITLSPLGRRLVALREDDLLAEAIGIDVVRSKMLSVFIGSLYAGIGGALYASYVGYISPRNFDQLSSVNIWLMVAFGGRGTILGPVIGALVLTPLPFLLQQLDSFKDIIFGALIILVMVLMPAGLYGEIKRRVAGVRRDPKKRGLLARVFG